MHFMTANSGGQTLSRQRSILKGITQKDARDSNVREQTQRSERVYLMLRLLI
jgi:hypothetical protein